MLDRIVLKEHQMFLVCDGDGDIAAHNVDGHGLYWHDTRFLSLFELSMDAGRPQLLSSTGEHNFMMTLQFANLAFQASDGRDVPPADAQHPPQPLPARRPARADRHLQLQPVPGPGHRSALTFGSDFRDMFDIRGYARRSKHGAIDRPAARGHDIVLGYTGLDEMRRETRIRFDQRPDARSRSTSRTRCRPGALRRCPGISGAGDPRAEVPIRPPTATAIFELESCRPASTPSLTCEVLVEPGRPPARARRTPSATSARSTPRSARCASRTASGRRPAPRSPPTTRSSTPS